MDDAGRQPAFRRTVSSWLWWLAHGLVVIEVAIATRAFTFFQDDFVFLSEARTAGVRNGVVQQQGLTLHYLGQGLFEHFSPVARLLFWFVGLTDSPRGWSRLLILVLVVAFVVSLGILVATILDRTLEAALVVMIAGQGLIVVHLASWTTASFNMLPALSASALSLAAGIRFLRECRPWWYGAASVVFLAIGLLDYELVMFVPVFLGFWFLCCVAPRVGLRASWLSIRATVAYWLALAAVTGASAVNYRVNYYNPHLPRPTISDFVETLWHSWWQALFPATLGVFSGGRGASIWGLIAVLAWAGVVVLAFLRLGKAVVGPVALALSGWLVCTATLAWGRAALNGPYVGIDLFYAVMPLIVLVLAVSEGLRLAASPPIDGRRSTDISRRRLRVVGSLAALALVSAVLTQVNSSAATDPNGIASASRRVIDTFLADVRSHAKPPAVLSAPVPNLLVLSNFFPYNYASRSLGLLTDRVRWDDAQGQLYQMDAQGHLAVTTFVPLERAQIVDARVTGSGRRGTRRGCFVMVDSRARIRIPFPKPVYGQNLAVRLDGSIDRASVVTPVVSVDGASAQVATGTLMQLQRGAVHVYMFPAVANVTELRLSGFVPGATICVQSVTAGQIVDR